MLTEDEVTSEWLQQELSEAENALTRVERQRDKLAVADHTEVVPEEKREQSPLQRLIHLQDTVEYLQLTDDIVQCQKKQQTIKALIPGSLEQQVVQCEVIGQLLCRHPPPAATASHYGTLFGLLLEQEYQPLYSHAKWSVITSLRQLLQSTGYPAVEACSKLMLLQDDIDKGEPSTTFGRTPNTSSFAIHCQLLTRLQLNHHQVNHHVATKTPSTKPTRSVVVEKSFEIMVVELLRPIVERVRYHFVEKRVEQPPPKEKPSSSSSSQQNEKSLTVSRLDHLPEWIITYIREHVLLEGGPWDLIRQVVVPHCVKESNGTDMNGDSSSGDDPNHVLIYFLNEVVRLIQWVLIERNFFRDPQVAGPRSNPILLCRAVEQLMTLDAALRDLLPAVGPQRVTNPQLQHKHAVLLKLTDVMLAHDDDLLQWWLEREREFALSTLFEDDPTMPSASSTDASSASTSIQPLWQFRVAPRAELFCVLIRSIQTKATNFTMPGPYLAQVAVPLCMQFLDAIHETSRDLRSFLNRRKLPEEPDLRTNLLEWMDLINGTYLSASVLLKGSKLSRDDPDAPETTVHAVDHDLSRLGRSLERLQDVLVDEFGSGFVENLLMERAKLAVYLMQAPHMLSHDGDEFDADVPSHDDIPAELQTVKGLLDQLLHVCDAVLAQVALAASEGDNRETEASLAATWEVAKFAAQGMKRNVMNRLAEKFLEIILDEGMVPDIVEQGARKFALDIRAVVGDDPATSGPLRSRLTEVAFCLTLPSKQLVGLKSALMGLTRSHSAQQQVVDVRQIAADGTIYDEAVSMIRAKGFVSLDVEDVISILNRRRGIVM